MPAVDIRLDELEVVPFLLFRQVLLISYDFHHALELLDGLIQPDGISKGRTRNLY